MSVCRSLWLVGMAGLLAGGVHMTITMLKAHPRLAE